MRRIKLTMAFVGTMAMLSGFAVDADAASARVRCEKRATRSKISVDGNNLRSGTYTARVTSGPNTAESPAEATVGDQAEFDFDSNRAAIAAGATQIARGFIADGTVRGEILGSDGTVVASSTVTCRVR